MTTATAPHPPYGPPLTAHDMPWRFYRVPITPLGEDAEVVMGLGHVEPRRFVAAARALMREVVGADLADDFDTAADALRQVQHRWAVSRPRCTAGDHFCPLRTETHCASPAELDEYGWLVAYTGIAEESPGAFPITLLVA